MPAFAMPTVYVGDHPGFSAWIAAVRAKFEQPGEFALADTIYSFSADFIDGMTPVESYAAFDRYVCAEDE